MFTSLTTSSPMSMHRIHNSPFIIQNCFSHNSLAKHSNLCTLMQMQRKFTIGLIQMACVPDPQENLRRAELRVKEAADQGAEVICLPELFRSQYFCQREDAALFDLAEPVPGPTTEALGRIAREKQVIVIAPVFERRAAGVYHNSAAIIDANGEVAGIYGRCTYRMIRPITKSSTSRPATLASAPSTRVWDASRL